MAQIAPADNPLLLLLVYIGKFASLDEDRVELGIVLFGS